MRLAKRILAVLIAVIVIHTAALLYLGRKVDSQLKAIKARGEPVTFADLFGPPIPEAQNAAVYYTHAWSTMDRLRSMVMARLQPTNKWYGLRKSDPAAWAIITRYLARNEEVVEYIETTQRLPRCRLQSPGEDGSAYQVTNDMFRDCRDLRHLAGFLSDHALYEAENGDMDLCVRDIELQCGIPRALDKPELMISARVKLSIGNLTVGTLRDILKHYALNESQARRLYDAIGSPYTDRNYLNTLRNDRVLLIQTFGSIERNGFPTVPEGWIATGPGGPNYPWRFMGTYPGRPWLYARELASLDASARRIDLMRSLYKESGLGSSEIALPLQLPEFSSDSGLRDELEHFVAGQKRARALQRLAQASLALIAFEDRYGAYPSTLGELRSKLGWGIPFDPYTGKDLGYRLQRKGFLIYSIGPDQVDDRGLKPWEQYDWKQGDIIWNREF